MDRDTTTHPAFAHAGAVAAAMAAAITAHHTAELPGSAPARAQALADALLRLDGAGVLRLTTLQVVPRPGDFGQGAHPADLARDHVSKAWEHATQSWAAERAASPAARFRHLRMHTGLGSHSLGKLRLEDPEGAPERRAHYAAVCRVAPRLAESLGAELFDVDSKYDPVWPSASDVTLGWRTSGEPEVLLLDVHSGRGSEDKLARLCGQALARALNQGAVVHCATLQLPMPQQVWDPASTPPDVVGPAPAQHYSLAIPALAGRLILGSRAEETAELASALEEALAPVVQSSLNGEVEAAKESQTLKQECSRLLKALEKKAGLDDVGLRSVLKTRSVGVIRAARELAELAAHEGLQQAGRLMSLPGKGVWLDLDQKEMRCVPPLSVTDIETRGRIVDLMLKADPLMRAMRAALRAEPKELEGLSHGRAVGPNGQLGPIPAGWEPQFDRRQTATTAFPNNVLAFLRRPRERRTRFRPKAGGAALGFSDLPAQERALRLEELSKKYDIDEEWVYAPHLQVLINNALYGDDRLETFLARGHMTPSRPPAERDFAPKYETLESAEKRFERYVESCIPDGDLAGRMSRHPASIAGRIDLVMRNQCPPAVRNIFGTMRHLMESHLLTYYDYEAQKARSLAVTMNSRTPENCVTLLEVPSYAAVVMTYVNSEASHFRTTWCKELTLSAVGEALLEFCDRRDVYELDQLEDGAPLRRRASHAHLIPAGSLGFVGPREVRVYASALHSRSRQDLEWSLERAAKAAVRAGSLIEMRGDLYTRDPVRFEWDRPATYSGPYFARREVLVNLTGFHESSQQNSISQTAQRYLHQSMGSLDNDPFATLLKLEGIRLRGVSRVASHGMMSSVYVVATLLRLARGPEFLMAANGEVSVLMPDLLRASSLAQLNVSCYSTPNQMNVEKANGVPSEALDVSAVWANNAKVRKLDADAPALRHGIAEELARDLQLAAEDGAWRHAGQLAAWVRANPARVAQNCRAIAALPRGTQLVSCFFFELWAHIRLRQDLGPIDPLHNLAGQSLADFFTTKGSFRSGPFRSVAPSVFRVEPLRKAAAAASVIRDLLGDKREDGKLESLTRLLSDSEEALVDLYTVVDGVRTGLLESLPLMRGSDKNAPGKNREISTLEAVYGMECVALERLHMSLSAAVPEDLILERDKDAALTRRLNAAQQVKRDDTHTRVFYINRDMSAHGPTHKTCSSAVTVCALAPNRETLDFGLRVVSLSASKKWLYPEALVHEALHVKGDVDVDGWLRSHLTSGEHAESPEGEATKTGYVMRRIREQFLRGTADGPPGSTWAEVADGMPGQGIFSVQASVSHAAVARLAKHCLAAWFGWSVETVVNSDDSTVILKILASLVHVVQVALRPVLARFIMFAGLCENEGKFTPTVRRPEFVSNFYAGAEPIAQVFKYSNALTSLRARGSLAEDLVAAASRAADAMKVGNSFYSSALVGAANMALVLDAHRGWAQFGAALHRGRRKATFDVLDLLPEEGGLPVLNPYVSVLSSLGPRIATYAARFETDTHDRAYARYLLSTLFEVPAPLDGEVGTDVRVGERGRERTLLYDARGQPVAVVANQLQVPSVDGVRIVLRRRKGSLRLAKQLGTGLSSYEGPRGLEPDELLAGPLLAQVITGLRRPIDTGEEDPSPLLQVADLSHTRTRRCVQVLASSPFAALLDPGPTSQEGFEAALRANGAPEKLRAAFLSRLELEPDVPEGLQELEAAFVEHVLGVLKFARDVEVASVYDASSDLGLEESVDGPYAPRRLVRKIIDVGLEGRFAVSKEELKRIFLRRTLDPERASEAPLSVARAVGSLACSGRYDSNEALFLSDLMVERLANALPRRYLVSAMIAATSLDQDSQVDSWVRNNFARGLRARWAGGDVRSRELRRALGVLVAPGDREETARVVEEHLRAKSTADLLGAPCILGRPLGARAGERDGPSHLELGSTAAVRLGPSDWRVLAANKESYACAHTSVRLGAARLRETLAWAARVGWYSDGGVGCRLVGPVASWQLMGEPSGLAYVHERRHWTREGATWEHRLITSDRLPGALSTIRWSAHLTKEHLAPLRDGLQALMRGLTWRLAPRIRVSGRTATSRPLSVTDIYDRLVLGPETPFEVRLTGHFFSLVAPAAGGEVSVPFERASLKWGVGAPTRSSPPSVAARAEIFLRPATPLREQLPALEPHRLAGAPMAAIARAYVAGLQAQPTSDLLVGANLTCRRLLETNGESRGEALGLDEQYQDKLRDDGGPLFREEALEHSLTAAVAARSRAYLPPAALIDRAELLESQGLSHAHPYARLAAHVLLELRRLGLDHFDTAAEAVGEAPAPLGVAPRDAGERRPFWLDRFDWADVDDLEAAARSAGAPHEFVEVWRQGATEDSGPARPPRAAPRGPGLLAQLDSASLTALLAGDNALRRVTAPSTSQGPILRRADPEPVVDVDQETEDIFALTWQEWQDSQ